MCLYMFVYVCMCLYMFVLVCICLYILVGADYLDIFKGGGCWLGGLFAELFLKSLKAQAFLGTPRYPKTFIRIKKLATTNTRTTPRGQSFGLTVLEAEKWSSSNQVEIKILLCKSTL